MCTKKVLYRTSRAHWCPARAVGHFPTDRGSRLGHWEWAVEATAVITEEQLHCHTCTHTYTHIFKAWPSWTIRTWRCKEPEVWIAFRSGEDASRTTSINAFPHSADVDPTSSENNCTRYLQMRRHEKGVPACLFRKRINVSRSIMCRTHSVVLWDWDSLILCNCLEFTTPEEGWSQMLLSFVYEWL